MKCSNQNGQRHIFLEAKHCSSVVYGYIKFSYLYADDFLEAKKTQKRQKPLKRMETNTILCDKRQINL